MGYLIEFTFTGMSPGVSEIELKYGATADPGVVLGHLPADCDGPVSSGEEAGHGAGRGSVFWLRGFFWQRVGRGPAGTRGGSR